MKCATNFNLVQSFCTHNDDSTYLNQKLHTTNMCAFFMSVHTTSNKIKTFINRSEMLMRVPVDTRLIHFCMSLKTIVRKDKNFILDIHTTSREKS